MSTQTPNLNLEKPAGNERPLVSVINSNMDKLDAAVGDVDTTVTGGDLQSQVTALQDSVSYSPISGTTVTKYGPIVMIRFAWCTALSGQAAGEYTLFTLPEVYRLTGYYVVTAMVGSGAAYCGRIIVGSDGVVKASTTKTITGFEATVVYIAS